MAACGLLSGAGCCVIDKQNTSAAKDASFALGRPLALAQLKSGTRPRHFGNSRAALSTGPLAPPPKPVGSNTALVPIIDKIAACVEANVSRIMGVHSKSLWPDQRGVPPLHRDQKLEQTVKCRDTSPRMHLLLLSAAQCMTKLEQEHMPDGP